MTTKQINAAPDAAWRHDVSGWLYPGVDVPALAHSGRWTWKQRGTAFLAAAAGLVFLYEVTAGSLIWLSTMLDQDVLPPRLITWPPGHLGVVQRNLWLMTVAGLVLICLHSLGGRPAVGLDRRLSRRDHTAAFGYYLRFACTGMLLSIGAFELAEAIWPQLRTITGSGTASPLWLDLLRSLSAGWCEEIIATALVLVLLERVRGVKGRTLAVTGAGTAIVILVHLSYHLHYGIRALQLIVPVYVTVLCWRHARSLPALVLGHIVYDVATDLVPGSGYVVLWLLFLLVGSYLDRRFWTENGAASETTGRP